LARPSPFSKITASHCGDSRKTAEETAAQAEAGSIAVVVMTSVTSLAIVACELAIALRSAAFLGLSLLDLDLDCLIHDLGIIDINLSLCSDTGRLKPGCHRQWFG